MSHALQLLEHPSSADTIYIESDTGENKSRLMHEDIQRELGESGVRVLRDLKIALSPVGRDHLKGAQLFYPRQLYTCASRSSPTATD